MVHNYRKDGKFSYVWDKDIIYKNDRDAVTNAVNIKKKAEAYIKER